MYSILRWTCSIATLMLVPSSSLVEAKTCTSTQLTQLTSIATTFSSSPDCAGSALDSSINSVDVICAGACMKLIRELQPDAPDCEYDGTNPGETMSTLVSWCDAASSSASASASASALASASGSSLASASGSADAGSNSSSVTTNDTVPICSMENVTLIDDINSEAETNADCLGSAGAAAAATSKTDYCNEDACVAYMTDVGGRLPNCTYGGYNLKQVIADVLAVCDDPNFTWAPSTTPPTTTTTTAPLATTQTPTMASSASSQTTDTPAPAKSTASALNWDVGAVLLLAIVFAVGNQVGRPARSHNSSYPPASFASAPYSVSAPYTARTAARHGPWCRARLLVMGHRGTATSLSMVKIDSPLYADFIESISHIPTSSHLLRTYPKDIIGSAVPPMGSWNLPGLTSNGDPPTQLKKSPLQPRSSFTDNDLDSHHVLHDSSNADATPVVGIRCQLHVGRANHRGKRVRRLGQHFFLRSDTGATSLDYCMNSDCVSDLSDAVDQLPDCTGDDEINRKTGLQNIVTYCSNVTEVLEQSASASGSADATGSGSVVSGSTSNVAMATGAAVAQLSVVLFFFAELL